MGRSKNTRQLAPDANKPRGGFKFVQCDIYWDQDPMVQKYIQKNGGSLASTIRAGLDALLKPDYSE